MSSLNFSSTKELRVSGDVAIEKQYPMSSDWELLRQTLEKSPVFGLVDHEGMRDAVIVRKWQNGEYRASVRGIGYFEGEWDEFVESAKNCNFKFVIPNVTAASFPYLWFLWITFSGLFFFILMYLFKQWGVI